MKNTENDETKTKNEFALSEKDLIRLQEAPIIDNNQFVIKAQTKAREHFVSATVISDADRRQYFSTGMGDDKNVQLAKRAQEAIKKIETDVAHKQYEAAKATEIQMKAAPKTNEGNVSKSVDVTSELDFGALITGTVLKDM